MASATSAAVAVPRNLSGAATTCTPPSWPRSGRRTPRPVASVGTLAVRSAHRPRRSDHRFGGPRAPTHWRCAVRWRRSSHRRSRLGHDPGVSLPEPADHRPDRGRASDRARVEPRAAVVPARRRRASRWPGGAPAGWCRGSRRWSPAPTPRGSPRPCPTATGWWPPSGVVEAEGFRVRLLAIDPATFAHGLRRRLQRHPLVPLPRPVRPGPAAAVRPPVRRGVGGLPPGEPSPSPTPWPRAPPTAPSCSCRTTTSAWSGPMLADRRPDLRTVHFSHTPFAGPDLLRVLPDRFAEELLEGLAGHHACGFHTGPVGRRVRGQLRGDRRPIARPRSWRRWPPTPTTSGRSPASPACDAALRRARRAARRPAAASPGSTASSCRRTSSAGSTPTTTCSSAIPSGASGWCSAPSSTRRAKGLPEYLAYRQEVESVVESINAPLAHRRLGADPRRPLRRLPPLGRRAPPLRRAAGEPDPRRAQPGRQGRAARERARRRGGPQPRGRRVGRARRRRPAGAPLRRRRHRRRAGRRAGHAPAERAAEAAELRRRAEARTPADWLADQLAAADSSPPAETAQPAPTLSRRPATPVHGQVDRPRGRASAAASASRRASAPVGPSTTRSARSSSSGAPSALRTAIAQGGDARLGQPVEAVERRAGRRRRRRGSRRPRGHTRRRPRGTRSTSVVPLSTSIGGCSSNDIRAGRSGEARSGRLLLGPRPHRRLELGAPAVVQRERQALGLDPHARGPASRRLGRRRRRPPRARRRRADGRWRWPSTMVSRPYRPASATSRRPGSRGQTRCSRNATGRPESTPTWPIAAGQGVERAPARRAPARPRPDRRRSPRGCRRSR